MGLHLPDSWQTTDIARGLANRKPALHWYIALAPRVKSCPAILPFNGGSGIPHVTTDEGKEREGEKRERKRWKKGDFRFKLKEMEKRGDRRTNTRVI